ncbi:Mo25-domain-containing protein [Setomelanomma holmii]|uniref:Mo25-domain-containing protein n=1 Tax=Setomelanomma holmii TaxID=210430 RepID=A0A9P4HAH2_9PLEO|nr:Mo25-domain-containing protein [Setomelanomma holmii]
MEQPHDSIREAKILAVAASDRVIPLLDTSRVDGGHFVLVFPFMRYDLNDLLHNKKLSAIQIKGFLRDLFSALAFVHSKEVIHRDVKPSNILLKSLEGPAYLTDFGIAWAPTATGGEAADSKITDVGTTCYRPPELLFGNTSYGCGLDLWAAGCTVAEALDPDHATLFDSGELGSDLALIQSVFKKLGTPNLEVWPEAEGFRDWGKVQFYEYPAQKWFELLPNLSETQRDLVGNLSHPITSSSPVSPLDRRAAAFPLNMASLFGFGRNKQKSPAELARETKELTLRLAQEDKPVPKGEEALASNLQQLKIRLQGTPDTEVDPVSVHEHLDEIIREDLLYVLAINMHRLPFESRKDAQVIFSTAFRYKAPGQSDPAVLSHIVANRPQIIIALCRGYDRRESAMPCGGVLREALKHDAICALLLYDEPTEDGSPIDLGNVNPDLPSSGHGVFWKFFDWIDKGAFEVSADAFTTFRMFFAKYNSMLIQSESYVTKRQSIKLLGEILLDRANYNVMTQYVDSGEHLKIIMKLLRDDRKMINYEGFHVFKVFVANPNKSNAVQKILISNREKLLRFLPSFLEDRTEDEQFIDEKSFLIRQIEQMPSLPLAPPAAV